jgi:hypothetical protein
MTDNFEEPSIDLIDLSVNDAEYYYSRAIANKHSNSNHAINIYYANLTHSANLGHEKGIKLLRKEYDIRMDIKQTLNKNLVDFYKFTSNTNTNTRAHWSMNYLGILYLDNTISRVETISSTDRLKLAKHYIKKAVLVSDGTNTYAHHNLAIIYKRYEQDKKAKLLYKQHITNDDIQCSYCANSIATIYLDTCMHTHYNDQNENKRKKIIKKIIYYFEIAIKYGNIESIFSLAKYLYTFRSNKYKYKAVKLFTLYVNKINQTHRVTSLFQENKKNNTMSIINNFVKSETITKKQFIDILSQFTESDIVYDLVILNFELVKKMSKNNIALIIKLLGSLNLKPSLFANTFIDNTNDINTYNIIVEEIVKNNLYNDMYNIFNNILLKYEELCTPELLDQLKNLDITKITVKTSMYFNICHKLLNHNTSIIDLHFNYSVGGKGYNEAKADFYKAIRSNS